MPRPPVQPSYRLHKARRCAVVTIDGRNHYLGPYDSPESHEAYARLIAEWRSRPASNAQTAAATISASPDPLTISKLILTYWEFAKTYYQRDGKPTKELPCMRDALRPLRRLYGSTPACEFGPKALKAVRQSMVDQGLCRTLINRRVNRIRRLFKWAVAEELVSPTVLHGLQSLEPLRFGRSAAPEREPVKPVPDAWVDRTLPYVSRQVRAMIELQRLTGMRPQDVCHLRACDIDMSGDVWIYEPHDHKTSWRGHRRLIPLGPQAQTVVCEFLQLDTTRHLFSPSDAEAERNSTRRANRKSKMTPSQSRRTPKPNPKRAKRDRYDTDSYRRAIEYGIAKAKKNGVSIPHWFPLQLRHSKGTEVRRRFGLEAAQVVLGHKHAAVTEVYAEKNLELAIEVARQTG